MAATLHYALTIEGVEADTFVVREYQGHDGFSRTELGNGQPCHGFYYEIELASRRAGFTAEHIVDRHAELIMTRDGETVQRIHGIVKAFRVGETGYHHTFYGITLVPAIERLALRHNSRIFQQASVPDIIATLLDEMDIQEYAFALMRTPAKREFCVQYRESDLAFIERLAAEEGMVYHIEQSSLENKKGQHTLVFTDDSQALTALGSPIPYHAQSGGISPTPYVQSLVLQTQTQTAQVHSGDYSFKKPTYSFTQQANGKGLDYQRDDYTHFDFPGRFKDDESGKAFTQFELDSLRRNARTASGESNEPQLQSGVKFTLNDHSDHSNHRDNRDSNVNREWVVVATHHQGTQPQALEEEAGNGATTYANQFKIIPSNVTWRTPRVTKPQVDGPMMATVVGPKGEEIFCDEHGRVKLHFPWDRYSNGDEYSSCWVRVSQGWAGSQSGMFALPRIGHEVIVSFLNGDPDQPIVTGRTFNASNLPPYALPQHKTKTVIRSDTHQGDGFNELSFEDQAGTEKVYLHAQKDFESDTLHDHITQVGNDKHITVEQDQFTEIKRDTHTTILGESRTKVTGDTTLETSANLQHKVAQKVVIDSGREISLHAGSKIVVESGAEITLKVGGSFIKLDAAGVTIVGPGVNINSGGSAGSGSKYAGQVPTLPLGMEAPVFTPIAPASISASVYSEMVDAGVLMIELCDCGEGKTCQIHG